MGYRKVLLPVSGRYQLERALLALEQALRIVQEDGEICFFHCVDDVPQLSDDGALPVLQRIQEAGIKCTVHITEGSAAVQIPKFANKNKCDAIVMFAGERNVQGKLSGKLVMGGIAERVLHATNIPLLLVRA